MQYTANTTYCSPAPDRRIAFQRKMEKASEWSRKPMTNRAECVTATLAGIVTFVLLFCVYMMKGA